LKNSALDSVQKKAWLGAIVETLWQVAGQTDNKAGQCISDWYYTDTAKKNGVILNSIEKYPDYTPSVILIALTEEACGRYIRK